MKRAGMTLLTGVFGLLAPSPSATADVNVSTYLNDNARTGQNLAETVLTPTQVASGAFGLRFFHTVDGYVYAQPLYVSHVNMPGKGVHNVVFVATEHDTVYAFDADSNQGTNAAPLWQVSLLGTGETSVPYPDTLTDDIVSEVGITGTPVIDVASQTLYVVSKSRHVAGGGAKTYFQRLHALSLGTGQEKLGGPVDVDATITVPGNGDGSVSGQVPFDVLKEGQRCGLVLSKGIVYVSWASHGDNGPYHGWVIGFKASDIRQRAGLYNSTPDGGLGGIWQAGAAPAVDSQGFLYFATGNGTFSVDSGGQDYGDSLVKLNTTGGLTLDDYFTPLNQDALNSADQDFGSGGVTILPDQGAPNPHLVLSSGKEGTIYVVNRDNMGHYDTGANHIVQQITSAVGGMWSSPAYWNGHLYYWGTGDSLRMFDLTGDSTQPISTNSIQGPDFIGYPGATPTVSASGTQNGIVWALQTDAYGSNGAAILRAYDASDITQSLFDSSRRGADNPGPAVKFTVPTVANGHVYVGTQNRISVFGLASVDFRSATLSTAEGNKTVLVSLTRTGSVAGQATVDYAVAAGTAADGVNFVASTGTVTFPTGSITQTFPVKVLKHVGYDGPRTVLLSLQNPQNTSLGAQRTALLTILDTDQAPGTLRFSTAAYAVSENALKATITVLRTGGAAGTVTVNYAASGGTAVDGTDYTSSNGLLTFKPGAVSATFPVTLLKNPAHGGDLTVNLALSGPTSGAQLGTPAAAVLKIKTTDPTLAFATTQYTVSQTASTVAITVRRLGSLMGAASVTYAMADGTAVNGTDYNASTGTVNIPSGMATRTFPVAVIPKAASVHGGSKTVLLSLGAPSGAFAGLPNTAVLTIRDPLAPAKLQLAAAAYSVSESGTLATVTVTRTGALTASVSVDYATADGTAADGTNYSATNGTLLFGPGQASRSFTVPILDDGTTTGNVTVNLTLSNPQGDAVLGTQTSAVLWIVGAP